MAEFGFASVISLVSVADKAKYDDFGLYLTYYPLKNIFENFLMYTLRDVYCRLTRLTRPMGRELGRGKGGIYPPPPSGARWVEYPSGARVKVQVCQFLAHLTSFDLDINLRS